MQNKNLNKKEIDFCKKEIDIAIEDEKDLLAAIELKLRSDETEDYPSFLKDIAFMQQIRCSFPKAKTFCLNIACDKNHYLKMREYQKGKKHERYDLFRAKKGSDNNSAELKAERFFKKK